MIQNPLLCILIKCLLGSVKQRQGREERTLMMTEITQADKVILLAETRRKGRSGNVFLSMEKRERQRKESRRKDESARNFIYYCGERARKDGNQRRSFRNCCRKRMMGEKKGRIEKS